MANVNIQVSIEHLVSRIVKDYILGVDARYCIDKRTEEYWDFIYGEDEKEAENIARLAENELSEIAQQNKNKLIEMIEKEIEKQIKETIKDITTVEPFWK